MGESAGLEQAVLKILSGVQVGAEVSLAPGEYSVGSGPDDDIQFIDVSLKAAHAKLRLSPGKIEVAANAGPVSTANGLRLAAGSAAWQQVEPLDIITAGTMRFALGPRTANWTSLSEVETDGPADGAKKKENQPRLKPEWLTLGRHGLAAPVGMLVLLMFGVLIYLSFGSHGRSATNGGISFSDLETARAAIAQFPFANTIAVKQEVDGTIYATGFVESPVERRAVLGAIEKTNIPVRFRVGVLESLRNEIDSLIKAEKLSVSFSLSSAGDLSLEGIILKEDVARNFVAEIEGLVVGLRKVDSRIRTARNLLDEITKLAKQAQIDSVVVFRLDGELVEVNGILPNDRIDSWVGFLQAYARRFGALIGLRSYVQLQNGGAAPTIADGGQKGLTATLVNFTDANDGDGKGNGILFGANAGGANGLDMNRLMRGEFDVSQLFAAGAGRPANVTELNPVGAAPGVGGGTPNPGGGPIGGGTPVATGGLITTGTMATEANTLIDDWKKGKLKKTNEWMNTALDELARRRALNGGQGLTPAEYLPILPADRAPNAADACRPGSRLTAQNLSMALFWLDLISVSTERSITEFERDAQGFMLDAALNPRMASECLAKSRDPQTASKASLYLAEAARNPDFIRFITRKLKPYALDISGVNLLGKRFVQIRGGAKMQEGSAPDTASRLTVIGELGVAIQVKDGFAATIYGPEVTWKSERL